MKAVLLIAPLVAAAALGVQLSTVAHAQASAGRSEVTIQCTSFGKGPTLECGVLVTAKDGAPLNGARITLGALMPSMPMAHTVSPVSATPTGQPGEYKGRLELEMAGVWAVDIDISGPARQKFTRRVQVMACQGAYHCPAIVLNAREQSIGHGTHGVKPASAVHKH